MHAHDITLRTYGLSSQYPEYAYAECACGITFDTNLRFVADDIRAHIGTYEQQHCTHESGTGIEKRADGTWRFECDSCGADTDEAPMYGWIVLENGDLCPCKLCERAAATDPDVAEFRYARWHDC